MSELLAAVDIADVKLDERDIHTQKGITDGNRCVREAAWVNDDAVDMAASGLYAVDNGAFVVGLECLECGTQRGCTLLCRFFDVGQSRVAVDIWFASPEEIQVGAIDEEDGFAFSWTHLLSLFF